jgi:ACS family tartrate transporter-like MFS transporter
VSVTTQHTVASIDPQRTALIKIRRHLLPYLLILYAVAFLDRVNIGYAKTAMEQDVAGLHAAYGFLAGVFFIGYVLFEVPSNLALRRLGARKWIARIMISWGAVAAFTGACGTSISVGVVRFTLGVMEAGFFPGIVLYLTLWLPRRELARAFAVFISAQVISMIIGAPISGLILDHIHWAGIGSWRWLFVLEGIPAVVLGVVTLRFLPDSPSEAKWLDTKEKDWITTTITQETHSDRTPSVGGTWTAFRNPQAICLALIDLLLVLGAFGLTFYLPAIIESFGNGISHTKSTLLTLIPFTVGGAAMFLNGWHSDRTGERSYHVAFSAVIGASGFVFLTSTASMGTSLLALSLAAVGAYGYISAFWVMPATILSKNAAPVGLAAINSVGSAGGFFGPYLVGFISGDTAGAQRGGVSDPALYVLAASFLVAALFLVCFKRVEKQTGYTAPIR